MARIPKETHTITLKAVFASLDGKDSDDDAARFEKQLRELIKNFKPESEFKYPNIISTKRSIQYGSGKP